MDHLDLSVFKMKRSKHWSFKALDAMKIVMFVVLLIFLVVVFYD